MSTSIPKYRYQNIIPEVDIHSTRNVLASDKDVGGDVDALDALGVDLLLAPLGRPVGVPQLQRAVVEAAEERRVLEAEAEHEAVAEEAARARLAEPPHLAQLAHLEADALVHAEVLDLRRVQVQELRPALGHSQLLQRGVRADQLLGPSVGSKEGAAVQKNFTGILGRFQLAFLLKSTRSASLTACICAE